MSGYSSGYDPSYGGIGSSDEPDFWVTEPTYSPPDMPPVNEQLPRSPGGIVETIKRAVVAAMRVAVTGTSLSLEDNREVHVDLEYPEKETSYPAVWVQLSLRDLQNAGIAHQWATADGEVVQQWMFEGEVTLSVIALKSIERDRIADALVTYIAFSRATPGSSLYRALAENPTVSMTINSDKITSGGQSTTIGVPWNPDQLAYEDNYRFSMHGQFESVHTPEGEQVVLRAIGVTSTADLSGEMTIPPGTWV
ncbi:minor tail protein [Rhodococcus phage E3]|uniref:minor tail protein n=1 Tax=Rhodococcus phage E3 TaxID=1007869 RepID=UPI0002C6A572|nr:minor tail protein [Rhodococcus phage E3]AEQ21024.1 minor tail protein [Rhodococcus phage E3]